jgi:phosphomannomutase/phosphoglucomutase
MNDGIFRQYDIRGIIGSEFDITKTYDLGLAIAYRLKELKPIARTCVVGYDGRETSRPIAEALMQAMRASGFDVINIGLCATPVLYFARHNNGFDAGLMVTASHNPKEYNGIKICVDDRPVWGNDLQIIKRYFHEKKAVAAPQGAYTEQDMNAEYIAWLVNHFSDLKAYNADCVIDCGNGTTGPLITALIEGMGWQNVSVLFSEVDGTFPHHDADPIIADNMRFVKDVLSSSSHQCGIGLDGDGDRMSIMTRAGELIPGDVLLGLFATELSLNSSVIYDVKSSLALVNWIRSLQLIGYFSPSGHSLIHTLMREKNALLGGEFSCHFFFADDYFGYDDGLYAMLRFMRLIRRNGKTADQLYAEFPSYKSSPEIRIPCSEPNKKRILRDVEQHFLQRDDCCEIMTLDGVRVSMPYGWALVRISNTQPMLSVRCESQTVPGLQAIKRDVIAVLDRFFDHSVLIKAFNT